MNLRTRQQEVPRQWHFTQSLGGSLRWAQTFRQCRAHIGQRKSRPAHNYKLDFLENGLRFAPGGNFQKGINSDQKKQPVVLIQEAFETPHRIDGIINAAFRMVLGRFQQRRHQAFVSRGGQRHHGIPVPKGRNRLRQFVRWNVGRHKMNVLQSEPLSRGARHRQVAQMYGIKSPAEQCDVHR